MSDIDTKYARDISFPIRFDADCDLHLDEDEAVIDQALNLIVFTKKGTVILFVDFGSDLEKVVFEDLGPQTELLADTTIRNAIEEHEPRVFLDKEFTFDEAADESKLIIITPYRIISSGKLAATRLVVQRLLTT